MHACIWFKSWFLRLHKHTHDLYLDLCLCVNSERTKRMQIILTYNHFAMGPKSEFNLYDWRIGFLVKTEIETGSKFFLKTKIFS